MTSAIDALRGRTARVLLQAGISMTKEQAIALAESKWWKSCSAEEAALFQLYEERVCMDLADFQLGVEKLLGRPVWTHEFAGMERLRAEAEGRASRPTFDDILALIPENKRVVISLDSGQWAGHDRGDAIKAELLKRDEEIASLRAKLRERR